MLAECLKRSCYIKPIEQHISNKQFTNETKTMSTKKSLSFSIPKSANHHSIGWHGCNRNPITELTLTSATLGPHVLPCSPRVVVLELQHVREMRRVLQVEHSPDHAILNHREIPTNHLIDQAKPNPAEQDPEGHPSKDLPNGVVP